VTDPNLSTACQMLADLAARKISARELLDAHVARNAALHAKLNVVVATDLDRARAAAAKIDDARARGEAQGPLAGLPMTIKDGIDVEGLPATSGNPAFAHRDKHCADAAVVKSVRDAGAIPWGKTNVPFMLGDFQSYNAIYGTTNNPYDVARTPGGSSGGAAAALATGITPLEIGSDIGGSLRHPANFCGVCSLKPTWGALSLRGHIPPPPGFYSETDLGVVGPMARNAGDLRLLWNILRGGVREKPRAVKGARIVVWDEEPGFPLARAVRAGVGRAADALADAGANVERGSPPVSGDELMDVYLSILMPIMGLGLPDPLIRQFEAMRESDLAALAKGEENAAAGYRLRVTASHRDVLRAATRRQAMKDKLDPCSDFDRASLSAPARTHVQRARPRRGRRARALSRDAELDRARNRPACAGFGRTRRSNGDGASHRGPTHRALRRGRPSLRLRAGPGRRARRIPRAGRVSTCLSVFSCHPCEGRNDKRGRRHFTDNLS